MDGFSLVKGSPSAKKACMKENPSTTECLKAAANLDLKVYGTKFLPDDIHKGKIESIKGPGVLQIQKLRNISAPRANEESSHAPRLLKFQLTDGPISCQGLEYSTISDISLSTPPGTKIRLIGSVPVKNGMLLLDDDNTKVIGGEVESLINKWKLNKSLAKHSRNTASTEGGPPPFVPFNHGKSRDENRGKGNTGYVPNGHEDHSDSQHKPDRYRGQDNAPRKGRDRDDQGDRGRPPRGGDSFRGRGNQDRRNENRQNQRDNRGNRDSRGGNRNYESNAPSDRYNQRRTDHNRSDRNEKPSKPSESGGDSPPTRSRSGSGIRENGTNDVSTRDDDSTSRSMDGLARGAPSGRGSARGGRGGRREPLGRGRSSSVDQDESEDYRARQPSDKGTLWDFVKLSIEPPVTKSGTPPPTEKETKEVEVESQTATNHTTQANQTNANEATIDSEPTDKTRQQPTTERTDKRTKTDTRPTSQPGKDQQKTQIKNTEHKGKEPEKTSRHQDNSSGSNRDHKQRSYQQRQQQSGGQGRGRGPRGRHDDGRSYNQSLPPRLQKKQQQYQQQQHYMSLDKETRDKSSSPGSGSGSETRLSQSPSVDSSQSSKGNDDSKQQRRQKNYPRQQRQQNETEQPRQSQYDTQPVQSSYLTTQQSHPYHVEHVYEQHEGAPIMQQEYNYQQQHPPPPTQQYPVYQMQTQMGPPQAVMVTQPITSPSQQHIQAPITTAQIRWKKGNQCLALRRDGQLYSAKIEHVTPDGQQCMVSFQDFHGGCEMLSITALRPFPVITWSEHNAQSLPVTTMTHVPIYAQPTQVAMVPRPQVMVPVQAQPPAYIAPKGPIASPSNVPPPQGLPQPPPGMQWQPAPVGYHDLRAQAAYQPAMIHYDPMAQAPVRQAYYPMPPPGTMQFVRGIKELHGQDLYPHQGGPMNDNTDTSKIQPTTTVYYNIKQQKKTNSRPPQALYVAPRPPQAYEANN